MPSDKSDLSGCDFANAGFHRFQLHIHLIHRLQFQVIVRVVDPGDYGVAGEFNLFCLRTREHFHCCGISGGNNSLAAYRQCFHVRLPGIASEYFPVEQDSIGRRVLPECETKNDRRTIRPTPQQ